MVYYYHMYSIEKDLQVLGNEKGALEGEGTSVGHGWKSVTIVPYICV